MKTSWSGGDFAVLFWLACAVWLVSYNIEATGENIVEALDRNTAAVQAAQCPSDLSIEETAK